MLKKCFVPSCPNNNQDSPLKLFLSVPKPDNRRKLWFKSVGAKYRSSRSVLCCEDHFDLSVDAENWVYFKTFGGRIILHEHVVPHLNLEANSQTVDYSQLSNSEKKLQLENMEQMKHALKKNHVIESSMSNALEKLFQNTYTESETAESSAPMLVGFLINDNSHLLSHQNNNVGKIDSENSFSNSDIVNNEVNNFGADLGSEYMQSSPINEQIIHKKSSSRTKRRRKSPIRVKHDFSDEDSTFSCSKSFFTKNISISSDVIHQKSNVEIEKSSVYVNNKKYQNLTNSFAERLPLKSSETQLNEPTNEIQREKSPIFVKVLEDNIKNYESVSEYIQNSSSNSKVNCQNSIDDSPIYIKKEPFKEDENSFITFCNSEYILSTDTKEVEQNNTVDLEPRKPLISVKNKVFEDDENRYEQIFSTKYIQTSNFDKVDKKSSTEIETKISPICIKNEIFQDDTIHFESISNSYTQDSSSTDMEISEKSAVKLKRRRKSPICVKVEVFEDDNNFDTDSVSNSIYSKPLTEEIVYLDMENVKSPICVKNEIYDDSINNFQLISDKQIKIEDQLNTELIIKDEIYMNENENSYVNHNQSSFLVHDTIHNKISYICNVCDKTYERKSRFNKHMKKHTEQPWHSCDICDKTFTMQQHLIAHKQIHVGDRPYTCDICAKQFTQKGSLVIHERTHTGVKPYSCDFCDKSFAKKSYLTSHKRTHTGEKPYKCDICERKFSQLSTLRVHKQNHTGERPHACDVCYKTFTKRNYLVIHKIQHIGTNIWLS